MQLALSTHKYMYIIYLSLVVQTLRIQAVGPDKTSLLGMVDTTALGQNEIVLGRILEKEITLFYPEKSFVLLSFNRTFIHINL